MREGEEPRGATDSDSRTADPHGDGHGSDSFGNADTDAHGDGDLHGDGSMFRGVSDSDSPGTDTDLYTGGNRGGMRDTDPDTDSNVWAGKHRSGMSDPHHYPYSESLCTGSGGGVSHADSDSYCSADHLRAGTGSAGVCDGDSDSGDAGSGHRVRGICSRNPENLIDIGVS
jgi:hypothetical protein